MTMKKTIAIIGSMDTKGKEIKYAKDIIESLDLNTIVIDMGVREKPEIEPNISSEQVLNMYGYTWEDILKLDKVSRINLMTEAITVVIKKLYEAGRFQGVFSMGGAQNTMMATSAMRALPYGVPKVMLSTMASGKRTFGPLVSTKDVVVMHSVADISGLNSITRNVIKNAVFSTVGMVQYGQPLQRTPDKLVIGATMLGITGRGVSEATNLLEEKGIETITFHANGVGGKSMEELIESGFINGALDLTLHEITSEVLGGYCTGANNRLLAAARKRIPQVISAGAIDMLDYSTEVGEQGYPKDWKSRQHIFHNSSIIHMKVTEKEIIRIAEVVAERINLSNGPVTVLFPLKGFCEAGASNGAFYNPKIDNAFIATVRKALNPKIKWVDIDANINDYEFSEIAANEMLQYLL